VADAAVACPPVLLVFAASREDMVVSSILAVDEEHSPNVSIADVIDAVVASGAGGSVGDSLAVIVCSGMYAVL
jgi:hypothetical protein